MLGIQILLAVVGISAGAIVAGGLISFIVSLGVVSDFADRTRTARKILLYEDAIALGGVLGNAMYIYQIPLPSSRLLLGILGLLAGIFTGCWAMALAEVLNVFPIFIRRLKIIKAVPFIILGIAIGKGLGCLLYFMMGW